MFLTLLDKQVPRGAIGYQASIGNRKVPIVAMGVSHVHYVACHHLHRVNTGAYIRFGPACPRVGAHRHRLVNGAGPVCGYHMVKGERRRQIVQIVYWKSIIIQQFVVNGGPNLEQNRNLPCLLGARAGG